MQRSIDGLRSEIEGKIADIQQLKREVPSGSDAEARQSQLDSGIASAERELSALDQLRRGNRFWPEEKV